MYVLHILVLIHRSGVQQMEEFATWRDRQFGLGENGAFGGIPQFEFNVRVLTTGWWPSFTNVSVRLPDIFEKCQKAYEQFYYQNSQNRLVSFPDQRMTNTLDLVFFDTGNLHGKIVRVQRC